MDPKLTALIKISGPIKSHWASVNGLNFNDLLSSSEYKEKHREEMISWSDSIRDKDYGFFCKAAVEMYNAKEKPIWIVSDIRRRTDIKWFRENYGIAIKTIRVVADDNVRKERGWVFVNGIDDVPSECDLDSVKDWDIIIHNNGTENLETFLVGLINETKNCLELSNIL
ncbi:hypothetical protein AAG570_006553 [Ranatra chinensis]|uniref:Phosphomevalonate kinase n=1 Tax=Ranatra chinensis TaxID=642074 RepID=A0ABD0YUE6_9HEMI